MPRCCWCAGALFHFVIDLKIVKRGAVEKDEPGSLPLALLKGEPS